MWHCICDCGRELDVLQNALTAKDGTRSCGCARLEALARNGRDRQNYKICAVCGKRFPCPPSDKTITCSAECRSERKRKLYTGREMPRESIEKRLETMQGRELTDEQRKSQRLATEAAKQSPLAGPFETNWHAKRWVLKSPENVVYAFDNLALFTREHPEFFENPKSAASGISIVASCMSEETTPPSRKPPRGRPATQYKGWQVISRAEKDGQKKSGD